MWSTSDSTFQLGQKPKAVLVLELGISWWNSTQTYDHGHPLLGTVYCTITSSATAPAAPPLLLSCSGCCATTTAAPAASASCGPSSSASRSYPSAFPTAASVLHGHSFENPPGLLNLHGFGTDTATACRGLEMRGDLSIRLQGLGSRVSGLGLRVSVLGFRVWGFGIRVRCSGF